jgi:hypothetical protein
MTTKSTSKLVPTVSFIVLAMKDTLEKRSLNCISSDHQTDISFPSGVHLSSNLDRQDIFEK